MIGFIKKRKILLNRERITFYERGSGIMDRPMLIISVGLILSLGMYLILTFLLYIHTYSQEITALFDFFKVVGIILFFICIFFFLLYKTKIQ